MMNDAQGESTSSRLGIVCSATLGALVFLAGAAAAAPQVPIAPELRFEGWAEEVQPLVAGHGALSSFAPYVDHDVLGFRLEYMTTYRGLEVTVSGLVVFPIDIEDEAPILVWSHGTLFDERGAPSSWQHPVQAQLIPALHGMITFLPDYVGYGASAELLHPYILRDELVASVIDMIPAGRAFLEEQGVPFSDELYLWGFSEGGFVALATAHELDTNAAHGIAVAQVHAVSGPYDLLRTSSLILSDKTYPIPAYVAFLFAAYNDRYWKRPPSDFFVEPQAAMVARFQARKAGLGDLGGAMPETLGQLLSPTFTEQFENGGESEVKASLAANGVPPWAPGMPIVLYHGTADRDVPFPIGKQQYEAMLAKGADKDHLSFVAFEGADHSATIIKALRSFLEPGP
jgi:pimeloyl-ACP methyl ester carboxylesterase